jgi:hypothetical protein
MRDCKTVKTAQYEPANETKTTAQTAQYQPANETKTTAQTAQYQPVSETVHKQCNRLNMGL